MEKKVNINTALLGELEKEKSSLGSDTPHTVKLLQEGEYREFQRREGNLRKSSLKTVGNVASESENV